MGREKKAYRVFLSSTGEDLKEHRFRVHQALDRMNLQTSRMEVLGARQTTALAECCSLAMEADLLIVIVAYWYGWVPSPEEGGDGKKSITQYEVEAAEAAGKPILAFIVKDQAPWTGKKEQDRLTADTSDVELVQIREAVRSLQELKKRLSTKLRDTFTTPDDLATKVSTSLARWLQDRGEKVARLDAYLEELLRRTDYFEIHGIAIEGQASEVLRPRIEDLYIPLRCRDLNSLGASEIALSEVFSRSRRILIEGQPGAGKSTFLRLVSCMLARDLLGRPYKPGESWRQLYLGWSGKEPLPILLKISHLVELLTSSSKPDNRDRLLDLFEQTCLDYEVDFDRDFWREKFERGEVLLLLDELDGIADLTLRERVFRIFADAEQSWKAVIVVTSRPFRTETLRKRNFLVTAVESFRKEEIQRFLSFWVAALYKENHKKALSGDAEHYRQILQAEILKRQAVRQLATNPVMLTSLCVIHYNERQLPDARGLVYASVINWLLHSRKEHRESRFGLSPNFAAQALAQLSLELLERGKKAVFEVSEASAIVATSLKRERPLESQAELELLAEAWLLFECEHSGILEELSGRNLRFWHLTFEEFLAARELARNDDGWLQLGKHLDDPQWAETVELYITCLFQLFGNKRIDQLLQDLIVLPLTAELPQVARAVGLLGRLLPVAEACGYRSSPALEKHFGKLKTEVMAVFEREGAARVPVEQRIKAAEALGRAGDPRLRQETLYFLHVPGTVIDLGRFPVTVTEFHRFIENRGYEESRFWNLAGWELRRRDSLGAPGEWQKQLETPNRPVVYLSWYEASAYCCWLSELHDRTIRLPFEEEWQAAANHPGGQYPWGGDDPNKELANFGKNVGTPSPVGVYPAGAGPFGHHDLAGNVWEWCENRLGTAVCSVRGGAFSNGPDSLRSIFRDGRGAMARNAGIGFRLAAVPRHYCEGTNKATGRFDQIGKS